jgi:hypothetical protein
MNDPIEKHISREHHSNPLLMSFMKKCCNPYPGLRIEPEQLTEFIVPNTIPHQPQTVQQLPPPQQPQVQVQPHSVVVPVQQPQQQNTTSRYPIDLHFPMVPMSTTNKSILLPNSATMYNQATIQPSSALGSGTSTGTGTAGLFNLLKTSNSKPNPTSLFNPDPKPKFVDQTMIVKKPASGLNISVAASPNSTVIVDTVQNPEQAQDCLVAQLQYCRFMNSILNKLQ